MIEKRQGAVSTDFSNKCFGVASSHIRRIAFLPNECFLRWKTWGPSERRWSVNANKKHWRAAVAARKRYFEGSARVLANPHSGSAKARATRCFA
eukprot:6169034-Lingulodinium_polyedra.AAC.1